MLYSEIFLTTASASTSYLRPISFSTARSASTAFSGLVTIEDVLEEEPGLGPRCEFEEKV